MTHEEILRRQQSLLAAMRAIVLDTPSAVVAADAAAIIGALCCGHVTADVARTIAALARDAALRDAFAHVLMVESAGEREERE